MVKWLRCDMCCMVEVDEVKYNGIVFRRYPDSDNAADRKYYRPHSDHIKDGVEALHREIWKDHNGEIPEGHHIHHKDGNPANNDIENLECLSPKEHSKRHPENNLTQSDWEKGIEAAKEWHRSEEGSEWHSDHWHDSLAKAFDETEKECEQCGDTFTDESPDDKGRFCDNACKSAWRRDQGLDDIERECVICYSTFTVNKYSDKSTCSSDCTGALISWSHRV